MGKKNGNYVRRDENTKNLLNCYNFRIFILQKT